MADSHCRRPGLCTFGRLPGFLSALASGSLPGTPLLGLLSIPFPQDSPSLPVLWSRFQRLDCAAQLVDVLGADRLRWSHRFGAEACRVPGCGVRLLESCS